MKKDPVKRGNYIGIACLIFMLFMIDSAAHCQSCEYVKGYFGADGGVSNWVKPSSISKDKNTLNIQTFAFAVKGGIRLMPKCEEGVKFNIEGEWRSDFVSGVTLKGGVFSFLGGTEHFIGETGYVNFLGGIAIVTPIELNDYKQVHDIRPNMSIRIGSGQGYFQALYIPKLNKDINQRPSCLYLQIGFRGFSYQNVRWK